MAQASAEHIFLLFLVSLSFQIARRKKFREDTQFVLCFLGKWLEFNSSWS